MDIYEWRRNFKARNKLHIEWLNVKGDEYHEWTNGKKRGKIYIFDT